MFVGALAVVAVLLALLGFKRYRFLARYFDRIFIWSFGFPFPFTHHTTYVLRWNSFPGCKAWSSLPLVGHAYMLGSRPIPFLKKLLKEHGDVVRFDVGPQPTVLIGNFDILRDLFKREVRKFLENRKRHRNFQQSFGSSSLSATGLTTRAGQTPTTTTPRVASAA